MRLATMLRAETKSTIVQRLGQLIGAAFWAVVAKTRSPAIWAMDTSAVSPADNRMPLSNTGTTT